MRPHSTSKTSRTASCRTGWSAPGGRRRGARASSGSSSARRRTCVTIASFGAGLVIYAPWLIALLAIALLPAFVGEAHFNAQSYSLNFARTPERRELDYVRQTGASAETAKEVKIFGLNRFLIERYRTLAASFFDANRRIALRRAGWGSVLSAIGTVAYYVAYAYIVWRTLHGEFTIGDLTFLAGSFRRLRNLLEGLLMGFSQVAGQALYLDDLFSFFEIRPEIVHAAQPAAVSRPDTAGLRLRERRIPLPGCGALGRARVDLRASRRRDPRAGGRERRRQDDAGEAPGPPLRSGRGPHPARRARSARIRSLRASRQRRRHLPGLRALSLHGRGQHRRGADRSARRPAAHRGRRRAAASRTRSSTSCPAATIRSSASAFAPASTSRAASGRRSPSRAPTCATPSC